MAKNDIYQVTTTFVITLDGHDIEYHAGEIVDADDPARKRVPEHFGPVKFKHRSTPKPVKFKHRSTPKPVEQATAAPGEQRGGKAITTAGFKGR